MRLPVNHAASLALLALLSACGGGPRAESMAAVVPNGPAADYPMVIGDPFTVDGVIYTPNDRLNYDSVGYANTGSEGGSGVSAAHRTLPVPSYIEVTALDSGKTILVRIERRGPMTGARLVELSPGAAAQLGIAGQPKAAVRVRRVNPPESERFLLRTGQAVPTRMDTPKSLLAALIRKLQQQEGIASAPAPIATASPVPIATPSAPARPLRGRRPVPTATPAPSASPRPTPSPPSTTAAPLSGKWSVQVAAFSTRERAAAVATKLGAALSEAGRIWRVRLGPFATGAEARAALAKARAAGYKDARIQRAD